jgi:hypothetical protein
MPATTNNNARGNDIRPLISFKNKNNDPQAVIFSRPIASSHEKPVQLEMQETIGRYRREEYGVIEAQVAECECEW